ncbi:MAG: preprotein translocase subunit SecE [Candidatus Saccharibacteria bacterium]
MNKLINYFKASYDELKKVIWPTRKVALQLTAVVIITALLVGLYLTILGYGFQSALEKLLFK